MPVIKQTRYGFLLLGVVAVLLFTLISMVVFAVANHLIKKSTVVETEHTARPSSYAATPFSHAVNHGQVPAVQSLLQAGVDVNVHPISGKAILTLASDREYGDIVQMLTSAGVQITRHDTTDTLLVLDFEKVPTVQP